MEIYRRLSPVGSTISHDTGDNKHRISGGCNTDDDGPRIRRRLLVAAEVPSWYAQNPFILTGYRPVTGSIKLCLQSLTYLHNETVNIYSHLLPAVFAVVANCLLHAYFRAHYPSASWTDQSTFHINLTTSILCFGISSTYHTFLCHSEACAALWVRLDYVAIVFQIVGSFISGIYVGFYCEPGLQRLYWTMIGTLGLLTGITVVSPRLQGKKWRVLRLSTFVATGLSAFAPILHAASIFPYRQLDKQAGLRYYYLEGISIIIGVAFYATHFPESRWPQKFDIWGASHQVFHIFVVLGAIIHFYGILDAFDWNYNNDRCLR